ncbi:MAG: glycosyltransferase [Opitutaceae bacterium]|nr:glycosyltransferase [Opitutaceae bacterium]
MNSSAFHYLITIHNKEVLLTAVLEGIDVCAGREATIVPVLDGCTDGSARVVQEFARRSARRVAPVVTDDVHEIRAINAGLRTCGPGFCVVLQDDVILRDPQLENRLRDLHAADGRNLGCISLRMGGVIVTESLTTRFRRWLFQPRRWPRSTLGVADLTGSPFDTHPVAKLRTVELGGFAPLAAVFKSPIVFTPELRAAEPLLDENLAPHSYDDLDLSIRALQHGLVNGVLALEYTSEPSWGGTRKSAEFRRTMMAIMYRNQTYLWGKHRRWLLGPGRRWLQYR